MLLLAALGLAGAVQAESFFLTTRVVEIPEAGRVTNSVICGAHHELNFLPPPSRFWKQSFDTNQLQITWRSRDYTSLLRLQLVTNETTDLPAVVQRCHPRARILNQFTCYTAGDSGLAFDLEETDEGGIKTSTRLAFIPSEAGLVEITLTTPTEQFQENEQLLSRFLNSFRVEPRRRT